MIILRTLLMSQVAVGIGSDPLNPRIGALKGIAKGLFIYLNLQKTTLNFVSYPSVGTIATAPPTPATTLCGIDTVIPPLASLEQKLITYTTDIPLLSPKAFEGMFRAFGEWLNAPPLLATIIPLGAPLIGGVGSAQISFPMMGQLGNPCWTNMLVYGLAGIFPFGLGPVDYLVSQFDILSNYIFMGLVSNLVPPIPTVGTIGSAYVGTTTVVNWIILDVPDFPVSDNLSSLQQDQLDDIFNTFGVDDLVGLDYQDEESNDDQITDCTVEYDYETGKYKVPTISKCPTIQQAQFDDLQDDHDELVSGLDDLDVSEGEKIKGTSIKFLIPTPVVKTVFETIIIGREKRTLFTTGY